MYFNVGIKIEVDLRQRGGAQLGPSPPPPSPAPPGSPFPAAADSAVVALGHGRESQRGEP